jgi:hypothetical protein
MQNEGIRIAEIAAKFTGGPSVRGATCMCALGVRGAADGLRKSVSIRLSKKKLKLSEVRPTVRL